MCECLALDEETFATGEAVFPQTREIEMELKLT
jgi:hypothetical protein